jgi:hypothetical protein
MAIAHPSEWRPGTSQWVIAEALVANAMDRKKAFAALRPSVGSEPLVFKGKRADGSYGILAYEAPKGTPSQVQRCWYRVGDVLKAIHQHGWTPEAWEAPAAPVAAPVAPVVVPFLPDPVVEAEEAEIAQIAISGLSPAQTAFLAEVRRLRVFARERQLDHISLRPIKDGMRMIAAGISIRGCLHAMTLTWEDADRRQAGIESFDPYTDHPGGVDTYLLCLVRAGVSIFLFGDAGMGKSYWSEQLPERLGLGSDRYGMTPMTEGATPSWLLGRVDLEGFKPTRLLDIWVNGGVYLFDEVDAADPNMLLVMNGPLASNELHNPVDQQVYKRSKRCVIVFAGNTPGDGADAFYGARNELDFSTKDRVRMGRVQITYDPAVEMTVALANAQLGEDVFGLDAVLQAA